MKILKILSLGIIFILNPIASNIKAMEKDAPESTLDHTFPAEILEMILDNSPNIAFLNELSRKIELSPQSYDKIIESYVDKALDFYPTEKELNSIIGKNFTTTANSLSPKRFQEIIYQSFKRFLIQNNFGHYKDFIDSSRNFLFQENLSIGVKDILDYANASNDELSLKLSRLPKEEINNLFTRISIYEKFIEKTLQYLKTNKLQKVKIDELIAEGSLSASLSLQHSQALLNNILGTRRFRLTFGLSLTVSAFLRYLLLSNAETLIKKIPFKLPSFISLTPENTIINRCLLHILPRPEIVDPLSRTLIIAFTFFNLPTFYSLLSSSIRTLGDYQRPYNLYNLEKFLINLQSKLKDCKEKILNYSKN